MYDKECDKNFNQSKNKFKMNGQSKKPTYKMDIRSPFDNIFNMISGLPQGHEKPLKHALYNAMALFLLCLCCAVSWALYLILEPFIKPLIWALLVGSVLHPIKYNLARRIRKWFCKLKQSSTPVIIGISVLPVNIVNNVSEYVGDLLLNHLKLIIGIGTAIPISLFLYNYTPGFLVSIIYQFMNFKLSVISLLINLSGFYVVLTCLIVYLTTLFLHWKPQKSMQYQFASLLLWLLLSCYLSQSAGSYKILVFVILQLFYLSGLAVEVLEIQEKLKSSGEEKSFVGCLLLAVKNENNLDENVKSSDESVKLEKSKSGDGTDCTAGTTSSIVEATRDDKSISNSSSTTLDTKSNESNELFELELFKTNKPKTNDDSLKGDGTKDTKIVKKTPSTLNIERPSSSTPTTTASRRHTINTTLSGKTFIESKILSRFRHSNQKIEESDSYTSDFYLYGLFWACGVMLFWKNAFLLAILPIPILIYTIKHVGNYFGIWTYLNNHYQNIYNDIRAWCLPRLDAIFPIHIRGIYKLTCKFNAVVESCLHDSIDSVASIVVIMGLIIFVACGSIFICIQVYAEAIMLVQVGSNVVNNTIVNNPELRHLLPPDWDDTVDSVIDNAYKYGREGISKAVRSMMNDVDVEKSAKLEQQILELWDRAYQTWISSDNSNTMGPKVTSHAVEHSWNTFIEDLQKSPEMFNLSGIGVFLKQNIGTLMSLLESVWAILKGNISLILSSFSAFLSLILGGGTAVLNFILNVIVFLTTLFYLLSLSDVFYKPVEILSSVSPSDGSRFGLAIEQAITGVFTATGKMALFYGLWTWFIHNLFNIKIVYLPSALATVLAAIPFLGPYWACLPAVLDLWLAHDQLLLACLFALCQFAPSAFIDATIYQEIKGGGHPYLTGLAIAGGVFWLGVEGAIIGPLLLCGLFVVMDLSSTLFKETPCEERSSSMIRLQRMDSVL